MRANKLIVVDGIDGCGKTTICNYIASKINAKYMKAIGQGPIGKEIRKKLLTKTISYNFLTELTFMISSNLETVYDCVIPALESTSVVLDRFISSTYAYQIHRGKTKTYCDLFRIYLETVLHDLTPDLYIWINVTTETSMKRTILRGDENHYDLEPVEYRRKTIDGFGELYNNLVFPNQVVIDGNLELDKVLEQVDMALCDFGIVKEKKT